MISRLHLAPSPGLRSRSDEVPLEQSRQLGSTAGVTTDALPDGNGPGAPV